MFLIFATDGFRWMITPDLLQDTPGSWYIETSIFNSTWEPGLTLKITSFMAKCLFWDVNNRLWSTEGCQVSIHLNKVCFPLGLHVYNVLILTMCLSQVGEKTNPDRLQCLCNHLTLYGSSFFVMPNDVDISRTAELFATVNENYVVLALLCAFFGLYLVTLLWACYADRRASSKVSLCRQFL